MTNSYINKKYYDELSDKILWEKLLNDFKSGNKEAGNCLCKVCELHLIALYNKIILKKVDSKKDKKFFVDMDKHLEAEVRRDMRDFIQEVTGNVLKKFKEGRVDNPSFISYLDEAAINELLAYMNEYEKKYKHHISIDDPDNKMIPLVPKVQDSRQINKFLIKKEYLEINLKMLDKYGHTIKTLFIEKDINDKSYNDISLLLKSKGINITERQLISKYNYCKNKIYDKVIGICEGIKK